MRVVVLPREVSARIITSALARTAAGVNALSLSLAIPMLIEYLVNRNLLQAATIPLVLLVVLAALATVTAFWPTRLALVVFLVVCSIGAVLFQVLLLQIDPSILNEGLYLLNRPAVALVMVGFTATTVRAGFAWTLVGFCLSNLVSVAVALIAGVPVTPGYGPLFTLLLLLVCYGSLAAIQVSLRRRVPDFDGLEEQARRATYDEDLRARVTAAVHDTLLNDLSLVMNGPDVLDDRIRQRVRDDIQTLTSAEWLRESGEVVLDDQDIDMRNAVMKLMSEMQWRGLTVHVTGSGPGVYRLEPGVPEALIEAIRACLENVLRHSGQTVAEVDLAYASSGVTVVITDQGVGFRPDEVPADRLGLRSSVMDRIRSVGGAVRVWSAPGEGTSVVISIPIAEVVVDHEGARRAAP